MIGFLSGVIREKEPPSILLDVNGVGYEVLVPLRLFPEMPAIGERTELYTHLHVREDVLSVYGFENTFERDLFRALLTVNRVGTRTALSVLSELSAQELVNGMTVNNYKILENVPGIGAKTAKRLSMEMRDKVLQFAVDRTDEIEPGSGERSAVRDAVEALVSLGYTRKESNDAVSSVGGEVESLDQIIRLALQTLGSKSA